MRVDDSSDRKFDGSFSYSAGLNYRLEVDWGRCVLSRVVSIESRKAQDSAGAQNYPDRFCCYRLESLDMSYLFVRTLCYGKIWRKHRFQIIQLELFGRHCHFWISIFRCRRWIAISQIQNLWLLSCAWAGFSRSMWQATFHQESVVWWSRLLPNTSDGGGIGESG